MTYLVSGATGNVGSLVVDRLLARGIRPRVFVRDAEKAWARFGDRVDIAVGDLADPSSISAALAGVDAFFLVNAGYDLDVRDGEAATVARAAGVKRLVKLSSIDAREQNVGTGVWHARGEAAIRAAGVGFAFVQPSGFMANALYWAKSIRAEGVVRTSTGEGKIPFIHSHDIADVAVHALRSEEDDGRSFPITGPEALSYGEMAAKIGRAIGRTLVFQTITDEEAREQQIA
ncbi:MAG TPA: NAD(P)H-binding protein [Polyangiaceae bacterium]|jgi:uncharacterized protein YbjT (DUF2867 family)